MPDKTKRSNRVTNTTSRSHPARLILVGLLTTKCPFKQTRKYQSPSRKNTSGFENNSGPITKCIVTVLLSIRANGTQFNQIASIFFVLKFVS